MSQLASKQWLALTGGVGGAKLALGLSHVLPANQLTIVVNTADDFEHLGLAISPDLDTLMYTLAGINNQAQGWGLADETWHAMSALERLGGDVWFRLGDKDLATHLRRTEYLRQGFNLSEVTTELCKQLDIQATLLPMSNDPVRTKIITEQGEMPFQQYFVKEQCQPAVTSIFLEGLEQAKPQTELMALLNSNHLAGIIICPSNPFVSIDPIIKLPGVRAAMKSSRAPVVAISPIVAGAAIKGPVAKMLDELNMSVTADAVAEYYGDLLDIFIVDKQDESLCDSVSCLGVSCYSMPTVMKNLKQKIELAEAVTGLVSKHDKSTG